MIAVSFGEKTNREPYLGALRAVEIDFIEDPPTLDGLSGIMLTGGTDVDPTRYGQGSEPQTDQPDKERDEREISLVHDALKRDIPILAICRGMQLLNVALGGTLTQHIDGHRVKEKQDVHSVQIDQGTKLASILKAGEYTVNSRHHQCVKDIGKGLIVSATAGDIIEALELPGHRFVVAVQWHPEDRIAGPDRELFEAFARAVKTVTSAAPA